MITISNLLTFFVMKYPPIITKGSIYSVPTHHVADCSIVRAVMATANAAGLNICFLFMAKINFKAIDSIPDQIRKGSMLKYSPGCGGLMMRASMSAVMNIDSTFACALNTRTNSSFVTHEIIISITAEYSNASGLYGNSPNEHNMKAAINVTVNT